MINFSLAYFKLLSCTRRENNLQEEKEQRSPRTHTKKAWQKYIEVALIFFTALALLD